MSAARSDAFETYFTALSAAFDTAARAHPAFKTLDGAALSGISRARELHREGDDLTSIKVLHDILPWGLRQTAKELKDAPPEARAAWNTLTSALDGATAAFVQKVP